MGLVELVSGDRRVEPMLQHDDYVRPISTLPNQDADKSWWLVTRQVHAMTPSRNRRRFRPPGSADGRGGAAAAAGATLKVARAARNGRRLETDASARARYLADANQVETSDLAEPPSFLEVRTSGDPQTHVDHAEVAFLSGAMKPIEKLRGPAAFRASRGRVSPSHH